MGETARAAGGIGVGGVVRGLGGFGAAVRDEGLERALEILTLPELEGHSAVEVAGRISEHLAASVDGVDGELMLDALRNAILEASALGDSDGFIDLERGLQVFLEREGPAGLIEVFLSKFVFDGLWANIESHALSRARDQGAIEALMRAVEGVCEAEVRSAVGEAQAHGELDSLDWFGEDGLRIGRDIFEEIQSRVEGMEGD